MSPGTTNRLFQKSYPARAIKGKGSDTLLVVAAVWQSHSLKRQKIIYNQV